MQHTQERWKACTFQTKRCIVMEWHSRKHSSLTLPQLVQTLLTPGVTKSLPECWHGEYTLDRAAKWIDERDQEGSTLLVLEAQSDHVIGMIILLEEIAHEINLRVGYLLAENVWGRGFATEILAGLITWTKTCTSIAKITAGVSPENLASVKVLEKNHFQAIESSAEELMFALTLS